VDAAGRTPLIWAAIKGDYESAKLLLQAGASTKYAEQERFTALHRAVGSGCLPLVELLLLMGMSVSDRTVFGDTALHVAAWTNVPFPEGNIAVMNVLYLAGAAIDARNENGVTALQSAACLDRVQSAIWLLAHGADPNSRDNLGDVPLFESICYNTHSVLGVLLNDPKTRFDNVKAGLTTLHMAALHADLKTLELLAASSISGVDPGARDESGRTAQEMFEQRNPATDGALRRRFDSLMEKAGRRNSPYMAPSFMSGMTSDDILENRIVTPDTSDDSNSDDDDSDDDQDRRRDTFEDALEELTLD